MRFSVRVNNDLRVAELTALAVAAEDAGFDQVWVSNDLFLRSAPVLAATVAARTSRIAIGIGVMNPYSVHPAELAMAAATLQEASGGRFLLGLGAGAEQFLGWAGLPRTAPLATTRTAVVTLRALLGHPDADRALLPDWARPPARAALKFPVDTPVPVYVGAMGPRMLAMAGTHADGALPLLYPPETYPAARAAVASGTVSAGTVSAGPVSAGPVSAGTGRANREVDVPACFWVSLSDDPAAARNALAEKLAYYGSSFGADLLAAAGLRPEDFRAAARLAHAGRPAAALIDDRMLSLGIAGDAAAVLARCQGLRAMGAEHLSFGPPLGPDPVAAIGRLGDSVLPALRARPGPGGGQDAARPAAARLEGGCP
jgi:5,10-methylenetetrahydromethanopterin reductase